MKAITCDCGAELRADEAHALADKIQEHVRADHPDRELLDDDVLQLITAEARDV